jgi:hypothetical protein
VKKKRLNIIYSSTGLFSKRKKTDGILKGGLFSLFIVCMILLFDSCKKESDLYPDNATINFKVYDDQQKQVSGAKVYLFDNYQSYLNSIPYNGSGGYAIDSAISSTAAVTFTLKPETNYWVLVTYDDVVRNLKLTNSGISSQLDKFAKGSVINANISIGPFYANLSFWTDAGNNLPIKVHFNGQVLDITSNSLISAPASPGNPNALNFQVPPGIYPYYAVGVNNCVWTGSLKITGGSFTPVQLNQCKRGVISFFNPQAATTGTYPINVVLDNFDNVGDVVGSKASFICGDPVDPNVLTFSRDMGTYTYVAKTSDSRCVWTGSFTISSDTCIVVQLPLCP